MHLVSFSIVAEFKNGGCLELEALLGETNRVPHLFAHLYTDNAAALIRQYAKVKEHNYSVIGDFKVEKLLQIIKDGSHFTGLASVEPHTNVASLEILVEVVKAFQVSGAITEDGVASFFAPLKQELVLNKGETASNYFTKVQTA